MNKKNFLIHISTDEVFGHVVKNKSFNEKTKYNPRSPYSASKAAADHLVSAWNTTYGFKSTIINCCNNFGPNQDKEKNFPVIINDILKKKIFRYMEMESKKREWIFVDDFISCIEFIIFKNLSKRKFCNWKWNKI